MEETAAVSIFLVFSTWSEAKCGVWLGWEDWGPSTVLGPWRLSGEDGRIALLWVGLDNQEGEQEPAPGQSPIYSLSGLGPSPSLAQAW